MIYAVRTNVTMRTLIELPSRKHLQPGMEVVSRTYAHEWVKRGGIHETGLYIDDGKVKYARADPNG